jgi:hypothetical protein
MINAKQIGTSSMIICSEKQAWWNVKKGRRKLSSQV